MPLSIGVYLFSFNISPVVIALRHMNGESHVTLILQPEAPLVVTAK